MKKKKSAQSYGIIGLGRFGMALAISLTEAGKEVIVIDRNESKLREIRQYTEYAFVAPDLSMETLKETGIQNCEVVVVCIGEKLLLGKKLVSNNFLDYISLDNSVEIRQIKVPDGLVGLAVEDLDIRKEYGLNIIAIENEKYTNIEVSPQYRLKHDDVIVVIGKVNNIDRFEENL